MNRLPFPQQVRCLNLLLEGRYWYSLSCKPLFLFEQKSQNVPVPEGNSLRATSRLTGVHRTTLMRLAETVGLACDQLHNARMRNLQVGFLECDEMWGFTGVKQKNLKPDSPDWQGDTYCWLCLESDKKVIVSYHIGKRQQEDADKFIRDVRARVLNRPQIVTDAYVPYASAISETFGTQVDYLQLNKYRGEYTGMEGQPDLRRNTTNHVEKVNLTVRTHLRRCTRRTNGHSKKLSSHQAAVALFVSYYNWCRVHESLSVTPCAELGLTNHIWTLEELVAEALATPEDVCPPEPPLPLFYPLPGRRQFKVYAGGRKNKVR